MSLSSTVPNPPGKTGIYTAAKAAQENLVLNLAAEVKENGVTANIVQVRAIDVENTGKGATPGRDCRRDAVSLLRGSLKDEWGKYRYNE